jgi:uncharacterized membrane protein YeaQ/YmgE (transglycosylase-associated protein family)
VTAILVVLLVVVLAIVLGVAVIGFAFKLLWLALVGLLIGALARLVLPGARQIGLLGTSLCGIGGSLIGGVIADALDVGSILGFLIAVAVAAGLVLVFEGSRRGAST